MRRVLIGVVVVVMLGAAGYVGLVLGRVAEDTPLVASPTVEELSISPTSGAMLVLPTVGTVQISPIPTMRLVTNGLDDKASRATAFLTKNNAEFGSFTTCMYQEVYFTDGLSTIDMHHRGMIFVVDDKVDDEFVKEQGFLLISGEGIKQEYSREFNVAGFVPGFTAYTPIEPGTYELMFSLITKDDVIIKDKDMIIVSASASLVNSEFIIMLCDAT